MTTLTKVDPMSWAKVYAVATMLIVAVFGLLNLLFLSSLSPVITSIGFEQVSGTGLSFGALAGFGVVGLIFMIPVSGLVAFVVGLIGAYILNLVLRWTGGLKLELNK